MSNHCHNGLCSLQLFEKIQSQPIREHRNWPPAKVPPPLHLARLTYMKEKKIKTSLTGWGGKNTQRPEQVSREVYFTVGSDTSQEISGRFGWDSLPVGKLSIPSPWNTNSAFQIASEKKIVQPSVSSELGSFLANISLFVQWTVAVTMQDKQRED